MLSQRCISRITSYSVRFFGHSITYNTQVKPKESTLRVDGASRTKLQVVQRSRMMAIAMTALMIFAASGIGQNFMASVHDHALA